MVFVSSENRTSFKPLRCLCISNTTVAVLFCGNLNRFGAQLDWIKEPMLIAMRYEGGHAGLVNLNIPNADVFIYPSNAGADVACALLPFEV